MKKQHLFILIILMSISLIGIIAIQLVWIKNALLIKQEQFDQYVYYALNRTSIRLERNESLALINRSFGYPYNTSNNKINNLNNHKVDTSITNDNGTYEQSFKIDFQIDGNNNAQVETYVKYDTIEERSIWRSNEKDTNIVATNHGQKMILNKSKQLNSLLNQMLVEFESFDNSIDKRLKKGKFTDILKEELNNQGIKTDFEYAVLAGRMFRSVPLHSPNFKEENMDTKYRVRLFPNDIFDDSNILLVHFPKKSGHIIRSISWLLLFSILLTLIIISTFGITIYIILKQKKIADIKSDFINNMTHEFKTPIATISLAADSISNEMIISNKEKVKHFTSIIKEENKRMNSQVENVLQMSLIDKQDFQFNIREIDVHSLIQRAIANISLQVEKKGGSVSFEFNAENASIKTDENHFMHIIYNLLDNANKYSPENPEIKVVTSSNIKGIYIDVIDNGIGMTKDQTQKIFDKFFRVSSGNIHDVKGFGLGLSYVKALVLSFKGNIFVKSEPDKGSTFQIFLPFDPELNK